MGILSIILSLFALMFLAFRGMPVVVAAPLTALFAVFAAGEAPVLAVFTQIFMTGLGGFIVKYLPLFVLGAVFGAFMEATGSARVIADAIANRLGAGRAVAAVVIACGVLTYGGVSLFVVAFTVYPIAHALFRQSGTDARLIPGAIALGSFTFTMTALPGSPAIQNAIPMPYFGTDAFAAPGLGIIAAVIMFGGGMLWLNRAARRYGFNPPGPVEGEREELPGPSFAAATAPIVLVPVLNFMFSYLIIPGWDTSYLSRAEYGGVSVDRVKGLWSLISALSISIAFMGLLHFRRRRRLPEALTKGVTGSFLPIFNTAAEVGYGTTIASLSAFIIIRDGLLNIAPGNPLVGGALTVNVLAGITGSASGGLSIALESMGAQLTASGDAAGISRELLHRMSTLACGGLDALPHNGAVITLLAICGMSHRRAYPHILVTAVVVPVFALLVVIILGRVFGAF